MLCQRLKTQTFTGCMGWDSNCTSLATNRRAYQGSSNTTLCLIGYSILLSKGANKEGQACNWCRIIKL
jgi:hypothetical protein